MGQTGGGAWQSTRPTTFFGYPKGAFDDVLNVQLYYSYPTKRGKGATLLSNTTISKLFVKYNTAACSNEALKCLFLLGKDELKSKRSAFGGEHFKMLAFLTALFVCQQDSLLPFLHAFSFVLSVKSGSCKCRFCNLWCDLIRKLNPYSPTGKLMPSPLHHRASLVLR